MVSARELGAALVLESPLASELALHLVVRSICRQC